jgi:hypothetical protein
VDFISEQANYRQVFAEAYGPFPHDCHFCGEPVLPWSEVADDEWKWKPLIHHEDGDHSNNDSANLRPAHWGCHSSHTTTHWWTSLADDDKAARIRRWAKAGGHAVMAEQLSDGRSVRAVEMGKKYGRSAGLKGGPACMAEKLPDGRSAQAVKMAAAAFAATTPGQRRQWGRSTSAQRWECGSCDLITSPGPLGAHQRFTGHSGRTRIS